MTSKPLEVVAEELSPAGRFTKGVFPSQPDSIEVADHWQLKGYGPLLKTVLEPELSNRWMLRKHDTIITVAQGKLECYLSRMDVCHRLEPGDELLIPSCRTHRLVCSSPCTYLMAYRMVGDEEEDWLRATTSYYTNCKNMNLASPRGIVDYSPRPPEYTTSIPPLPTVSTQLYITPTATTTDSEFFGKEASEMLDLNPRLRKKRLRVTVLEGRDLPPGTDSLYRVNLYYKDQVASTRTKLEHQNVVWDEAFMFEGNDKYLMVELQGIDRTRVNLDDLYHALLESTDSVVTWVRVPMVSNKPLEECSRIKVALQAEFNPRRESTADLRQPMGVKPSVHSTASNASSTPIIGLPSITVDDKPRRPLHRSASEQAMQIATALFIS